MDFRKAILSAKDLDLEPVEIPEWPYTREDGSEACTFWLRRMTGAERDAFEEETYIIRDGKSQIVRQNLRARLLVRTLVDPEGNRIFQDGEAPLLGNKAAAVLVRLYDIAQQLNGLTKADVDELEKNSDSDPTDASTSASQATLD